METIARTQRSDARRNREAVIESAIALLGKDPSASMAEIAAASKVGRTTVYRHFPNREDLLLALFERVIEDSREMTTEIVARAGSAEELLRLLAERMIDLGLRYRFLHSYRAVGQETLSESKRVPDDPVRVYLAEAQTRGEIREDMPLQWIASTIQALAIAALDDLYAGSTERDEAGELLGETLVSALLPR